MDVVPLLASLEPLAPETDLRPALALLAAPEVDIEPARLNAALRRALLLLATGGDPHRELELDGRAVTALATELDGEPVRTALAEGLGGLADDARAFMQIAAAVAELESDPGLAVRAWACALLAEELE